MMEPGLIYFTTKSGINCWNQTPPVSPGCHLWFPKLRLWKPSFTSSSYSKEKIKEIASFTHVQCMWERDISFRHFAPPLYIFALLWLDIGKFSFVSFRFVSIHKRAKGVRRIFSRLDRPSLVSKIKKIFSCWTKRTTFKIARISN